MRCAFIVVTAIVLPGCTKTNTIICGQVTCPAGTHCGPMDECVPDECGDGAFIPTIEVCDGEDSIDQETLRCTDFGFYRQTGPLLCSETCSIDTANCSETCGDHLVNGLERCDGLPATGASCADFGFDIGTIGCTDDCMPAFDFCGNIGWQLVPSGATDELYGIYLASTESGVAVGRGGQIIAAKDGIWIPVASPTTQDLTAIDGHSGTIIAVGNNGTIVRYDGAVPSLMASPTTENLAAISGNANGAIAVGANGTILRFNGTTWTKMTPPAGVGIGNHLRAVHMYNDTLAYAVGDDGLILKLSSGTWSKLTVAGLPNKLPPNDTEVIDLFGLYVVPLPPNSQAVFVAGERTTLARIVADNLAVLPPSIPVDVDNQLIMRTIWGTSQSDVFVAGAAGTVLHWNGDYLTLHDTPTNRTIYDIQGVPNRIIGVTRGGSVIAYNGTSRHAQETFVAELNAIYTDGTRTVAVGDQQIVRLATTGPNAGIWQVQTATGLAFGSVFALGNDVYATRLQAAGLYKSTNPLVAPTLVLPESVNAVWGTASPLRVIAVGPAVWESTDGTTFPTSPSSVVNGANTLRGIWASADGVWYAVGDNGFAMRRAAGATDWTATPTGVSERLFDVWGASNSDVFAVGEHGTVLHWNGTSWRRMYTGIAENLRRVSGNSGSDVFAVGTSFTRLHYDGVSWSRMDSYGFDGAGLATYRGTTYFTSGPRIERFERETTMVEGRCGDAFDNDSDGRTNCDDPACVEDPQCRRGGACETLDRVTCDTTAYATTTYTGVARLHDLPCLDHATAGPEASYRFVAEQSGSVTITVEDPSKQLDLVVFDATLGHCVLTEGTCHPATADTAGDTQTVTFTATADQIYYIVVDGPVGFGAPFELTVSCP